MPEALLSLICIVLAVLSYLERRDLYTRLMAKDLQDFKVNTQKEEPNETEEPSDEIPLEEAFDQIEKDLHGETN